VVAATFSLLPHLLAAQIMIQNSLVAQYYTLLHNYCQEEGFPSPPPPMDTVITEWDALFKPVQSEVESITIISRGRAVHQPFSGDAESSNGRNDRRGSSQTRPFSRQTITSSPVPSTAHPVRTMRIPSASMQPPAINSPKPDPDPSPPSSTYLTPTSSYGAPTPSSMTSAYAPAGPNMDYFARDRQVANPSGTNIAGKKKPPPPPPKRIGSSPRIEYVTALYAFAGQGAGDLAFEEGDRIRVVKKTGSTDDWWEGELRGVKGSFPANYCQ
jgi:amphiphysin